LKNLGIYLVLWKPLRQVKRSVRDKMKNIDKAKQIVDSNADTLSNWLQKVRKIREIEPYVRQAYENTLWQVPGRSTGCPALPPQTRT
jgi:hypothetical protein